MTPIQLPLFKISPIAVAGRRQFFAQFRRSKLAKFSSERSSCSHRCTLHPSSSSRPQSALLALRFYELVNPPQRAGPRPFRPGCDSSEVGPFSSNVSSSKTVPELGRTRGGSHALRRQRSTQIRRSNSTSASASASENVGDSAPTSAYVHLPFCRRRCFYCDFPILAVGERTEERKDVIDAFMEDYAEVVCDEIAVTARRRASAAGDAAPLKTVFFGGGTPSLVPVPLLAKIVAQLRRHFRLADDAEVSMELDPGTFDEGKLAGFLASGVTRVSLGVQAFQPELLSACGRAHGLQEVYDAVEAIRASGLENWSLDLMASLPNQTRRQWEHSLAEAVALGPAHISVYDLQIEEGTLFHRWFEAGREPLPTDDKSAELYSLASSRLRAAGFEHYEISNYARPGFQCKHNLVYWENRPYYAFGLGSSSYVDGRRFSRPRKFKEYASYVRRLSASRGPDDDPPRIGPEEQVLETVMLALRLAKGLDLAELETRFGESVASAVSARLAPFVEKGIVAAVDARGRTISSVRRRESGEEVSSENARAPEAAESGDDFTKLCRESNRAVSDCEVHERGQRSEGRPAFMRLTDPEGFLVSNEVISSVFAALPG